MTRPISIEKVIDHERLTERLRALRDLVSTARKETPDGLVSLALCGAAGQLLRDLYALESREPGARALPRLRRRQPPKLRDLSTMLLDAKLALDAFAWAHRDHDDDYGDEWLTIEGIAFCNDSRKNLSPSRADAP